MQGNLIPEEDNMPYPFAPGSGSWSLWAGVDAEMYLEDLGYCYDFNAELVDLNQYFRQRLAGMNKRIKPYSPSIKEKKARRAKNKMARKSRKRNR